MFELSNELVLLREALERSGGQEWLQQGLVIKAAIVAIEKVRYTS